MQIHMTVKRPPTYESKNMISKDGFIIRGGILGVRCGEIWLISSSTLPGLGNVSAKNVNKPTDFNTAVASPVHNPLPSWRFHSERMVAVDLLHR